MGIIVAATLPACDVRHSNVLVAERTIQALGTTEVDDDPSSEHNDSPALAGITFPPSDEE
jgi:hypothetical protein